MPVMYNTEDGQYYNVPNPPSAPQTRPPMTMGQVNFNPNPGPMYMPQTPPNPASMPAPQPQSQAPSGIPGRFVEDIGEVKPGEIPMDGTTVFFPTKDYKKVYAKVWGQDGKLYTFCFIPEEPILEAKESEEKSQFDAILSRFDELEAKLFSDPKPPKKVKEEK